MIKSMISGDWERVSREDESNEVEEDIKGS